MENNENDSSVDKLISQFENHKIKHSTSGAPRKKILTEINDVPCSSDAQNHGNPNLDWEISSPKKGVSDGVLSCYGHASEPKDDSSVKVYNPLTNYLSPRPKYLRFNPNRRVEILKRLENEGREELNNSPDSVEVNDNEETSAKEVADSSLSPPKVCIGNDRNGGRSEEDNDNVVDGCEVEEEEEEIEEERGWCLRGALKLVLTLIACLLSITYICSMNSPTNSPIQQAVWNLIDSAVMIKNGSLEFDSTKMHHDGFFKVEVGGNHRLIEDVELDEESYGAIDESFEAEIVENLEQFENFEMDESLEAEEEEVDEESYVEIDEIYEAEIVENLERFERQMIRNQNEDSKEMVDEAAEFEGVRAAQYEFKADEYEHLIDAKTDEIIDGGVIWLEEGVESSTHTGLDENETSDMEIIGGGEVDSDPQSFGQLICAKSDESQYAGGYVMEMDIDSSNWWHVPELSLESITEEIPTESKGVDETRSLQELVGSHGELSGSMDEVDEMGDDVEVGKEKSEWNATTVIGVSAVLMALTSLAIIYHSIISRGSTSSEEFEPVLKQNIAVEENVNPVLPSIERKVEFLPRASLSSYSMREAPRELAHHIHAPTVELIGEIVVGQPSNRRGYEMTISEDGCNATFYQRQGSLPKLVSAPSQPSAIELHPTTSNTSYGSFTTERRISKKEVFNTTY